jgi:hypothetical protein
MKPSTLKCGDAVTMSCKQQQPRQVKGTHGQSKNIRACTVPLWILTQLSDYSIPLATHTHGALRCILAPYHIETKLQVEQVG